jgi:hypothetical protein
MNLGKPVITHSVPWQDQAQIELVRHGECGLIASTRRSMCLAILQLANSQAYRLQMGSAAQRHIRAVADAETSISRVERTLETVVAGLDNPTVGADVSCGRETAAYLDSQQFGHTIEAQVHLRLQYWRMRLRQMRRRSAFAN